MRGRGWFVVLVVLALGLLLAGPSGSGAQGQEGEPSPGSGEAVYKIINTYQYPGFSLTQFHLPALAHYSYLLVSGDQALAVDPGRDAAVYLDQAKKEGARLTGVLLTHNHADFVAGHTDLARRANCPIYASANSGCAFRFQALKEGSTIEVGEALIKILVTPGHTLEGMCGLVASKANPKEPLVLLSGDTLLIGRLGRPDLIEGTTAAGLASQAFDTWTNKLRHLPDNLAIFPAHGGGFLGSLRLSDEPTSTLGAEKKGEGLLQQKPRGEFVAAFLENRPEAPQYFKQIALMNKRGPQPVDWERPPAPSGVSRALTDPRLFYVVDLRSPQDYAAGHVPNAVNMPLRGRFEYWVGTMAPWNANLVLYGSPEEAQEAVTRLYRIGYPARVLTPEAWERALVPLAKSELVKPEDLKTRLKGEDSPMVVDVRPARECALPRLGGALNLPLAQLSQLAPAQLDPGQPVVTVCDSLSCASLAVGLLERLGFQKVGCLMGGSEVWAEAGLTVQGPEHPQTTPQAAAPSLPRAPRRAVRLPERISAADLKRTLLDLPGSFDLVDVRPPEAFSEYHLPGSVNADVVDVMQKPVYLKGTTPLILVDRDGSLAMAVGGVLSQKTWRPIKVLHGGLEAYRLEVEGKPAAKAASARENPEKEAGVAEAQDAKPWWRRVFQ
jgi:glyoxylase-like metal-dependent hydrolase (beta-lactamase superfamily II)/rhodanese-related sulfurtransferase